ncbi:hypothetical protein BX666DRAFT_1967132 [Dichotomocladium elegans]|nr:hypothetical protein BX666DRAFT_1967132 [Dichotomocladium elegans]
MDQTMTLMQVRVIQCAQQIDLCDFHDPPHSPSPNAVKHEHDRPTDQPTDLVLSASASASRGPVL